jgi:hypothetical protein
VVQPMAIETMMQKMPRLYENGVVNVLCAMGMEFVAGFNYILLATKYLVQG